MKQQDGSQKTVTKESMFFVGCLVLLVSNSYCFFPTKIAQKPAGCWHEIRQDKIGDDQPTYSVGDIIRSVTGIREALGYLNDFKATDSNRQMLTTIFVPNEVWLISFHM